MEVKLETTEIDGRLEKIQLELEEIIKDAQYIQTTCLKADVCDFSRTFAGTDAGSRFFGYGRGNLQLMD